MSLGVHTFTYRKRIKYIYWINYYDNQLKGYYITKKRLDCVLPSSSTRYSINGIKVPFSIRNYELLNFCFDKYLNKYENN